MGNERLTKLDSQSCKPQTNNNNYYHYNNKNNKKKRKREEEDIYNSDPFAEITMTSITGRFNTIKKRKS